ncbi:hypothetical protein [Polaribacter marinivivus]|uniref:Lipoprotein n=1 Tax=Polaribacter marinivivus TaxID=1524260 RepID=A0ABV8RA00_9FLAO|nr:hypothetical protein [uncultured Polaribacter sp.]
MKRILYITFLSLTITTLVSCGSRQVPKVISGYYSYDTECIRKDAGGEMLVRAWGKGLNQKEAELDARKKAVDDLLFKGIRGTDDCSINPIISNPNAKEDAERKMYRFFKDKGKFRKFVSRAKAEKLDEKEIGQGQKAYGLYFTVDTRELRKLFVRKLKNK